MTLKNAAVFTALTTILAGSVALANPPADTNQDGVITRAEFIASSEARFAKSDLNADGYISEDERKSARSNQEAERKAEHFNKLDANGDGVVSRDEFETAGAQRKENHREKMQARRDINQDGQVDDADREAFREKMESRRKDRQERRKEMGEKRGDQAGNRDGGGRGFGKRGGKNRMAQVDTNGDNLISAQEYRAGAEKMFDHMDVDGDGQLVKGEGKRKRRKGKRRR